MGSGAGSFEEPVNCATKIEASYPALKPQSSNNPVVQILDRKRAAEYLVVRHDGSLEWLHQDRLQELEERSLVKSFERRLKRTDFLKCASVKHYGSIIEEDSEDEVHVSWENCLHQRYGPG